MANQSQDAAKAEQEYMERLAQEFSSLPDRELPQEGSGSSSARMLTLRTIFSLKTKPYYLESSVTGQA